MLITLLILAHMALPVFHAFSIYIVYCFYKIHICGAFGYTKENGIRAHQGNAAQGGSNFGDPLLLNMHDGNNTLGRDLQKPRLCQKCQLAYDENGGSMYRCMSTPLLEPIETTCWWYQGWQSKKAIKKETFGEQNKFLYKGQLLLCYKIGEVKISSSLRLYYRLMVDQISVFSFWIVY